MNVAMLGSSYPIRSYMRGDAEQPVRTPEEKQAEARKWFDLLLTHGREYVDTLFNSDPSADPDAYNQAKKDYEEQNFFQRNQTLIIGLGVIGGVVLLAGMTKRRR